MPKISVIIPVYNVEQYLCECLDSVINQTFQNIEIICVNDGSTDGSLAILEEYALKDTRIQIITKENGGLNSARNVGLDSVSGKYFAILDADDWIDISAYEKAYNRATESNADMTQFSFHFIDFPNSQELQLSTIAETEDSFEKIKLVNNNISVCWCYLWKTEFVKQNNLRFHNELMTGTEVPFTYRASLLANKIACLPERLYYYRYRTNSLTGNKKSKRFLQRPLVFTLVFSDIAQCNISKDIRLYLFKIKWDNVFNTYYYILDKSLRSEMQQCIRSEKQDDEYELLKKYSEEVDFPKLAFYTLLYSPFVKERMLTRINIIKHWLKTIKGNLFDWIAKHLIPYFPWLQMVCQTIDSQQEEIQCLNTLKNKKENNNG